MIVPSYREGKVVGKNLISIDQVLSEKLPRDFDYEIICVEDGQVDDTSQKVKEIKSDKIKLITYKQNKGKGYAVRQGMKQAKGDKIAFIDAGGEIKAQSILMLLAHMQWYKADVIVGSKRHPVSRVEYPINRKILSIGYQMLIKVLFNLQIRDTQSGIKIFRRNVIDRILPKLLVKRYAMDIEMLVVTKACGYNRIYEAPIELDYQFSSLTKASSLRTIVNMFRDTLAVFFRLRILKFYTSGLEKNKLLQTYLRFTKYKH